MMKMTSALLCTGLLALSACGDDGGGESTEPVTDMQTVELGKQTAQQSSSLATLMVGADSAAAEAPLNQVGTAINSWVNQYRTVQAQAQASAAAGLTAVSSAQTADGEEVSFEDGHLSARVSYPSSGGNDFTYAVEMDIGTGESGGSFDGTFEIDYRLTTPQYNVDYSLNATYDALQLDPSGCAIGGGISVDFTLDLSGEIFDMLPAQAKQQFEQSAAGSGTIKASYGPNCGDVSVEGT